ncbi:MAG: hypothetical protein J7619_29600 [Dyadobacter sp.]|uniref:hypothetical protein n=1 Tax=Dyadobacter sp. TaxID=1914288 RepID=UPI001AFE61D2|nr:hypothetical protein [Dyadobacter sp.]MBO9616878.1 hypothetical protein [Dyadobacter sp.]
MSNFSPLSLARPSYTCCLATISRQLSQPHFEHTTVCGRKYNDPIRRNTFETVRKCQQSGQQQADNYR